MQRVGARRVPDDQPLPSSDGDPEANLARGMRQLNGIYTQHFNRRHQRVGHVFQGRYKAIIVQKEAYLLELARHIVLNPVRARIVCTAKDWPWSSYRATAGLAEVARQRRVAFRLWPAAAHGGRAVPGICGRG